MLVTLLCLKPRLRMCGALLLLLHTLLWHGAQVQRRSACNERQNYAIMSPSPVATSHQFLETNSVGYRGLSPALDCPGREAHSSLFPFAPRCQLRRASPPGPSLWNSDTGSSLPCLQNTHDSKCEATTDRTLFAPARYSSAYTLNNREGNVASVERRTVLLIFSHIHRYSETAPTFYRSNPFRCEPG
jgi:hypothetical protein